MRRPMTGRTGSVDFVPEEKTLEVRETVEGSDFDALHVQEAVLREEPKTAAPAPTQYGVRLCTPADIPFVQTMWRNTYRESPFAKGMTREVFHRHHRELIENIMKWCPVYVAFDMEVPSLCLGFICGGVFGGFPVVNFLFVKRGFRGFGIGRQLLEHIGWTIKNPIVATHWMHTIAFTYDKGINVVFNPYLVFSEFRNDGIKAPARSTQTYTIRPGKSSRDGNRV